MSQMFCFVKTEWLACGFLGAMATTLLVVLTDDRNGISTNKICKPPSNFHIIQKKRESKKDDKEESKETTEQVILKRRNCSKKGFDEQSIIALNNNPLPDKKWSPEVCQNSTNCVPPFIITSKEQQYYTSKTTKSVSCLVRKSMSRILNSLSCMLNEPLKFFYRKQSLIEDGFDHGCAGDFSMVFHSFAEAEKKANISLKNGWNFLMITRDPMERFLSGFIHMCIFGRFEDCSHNCFGCGANMTCFMEKLFKNLQKIKKLNGTKMTVELTHSFPQTWFCELGQHLKDLTFLRYNSNSEKFFDTELGPFLKSRNVSKIALEYIRDQITTTRTKHSTNTFNLKSFLEERLKKSPYLIDLLLRIYYFDYKYLNYSIPTVEK